MFFAGCSPVPLDQVEDEYIRLTFSTKEIVHTRSDPHTNGTSAETRLSTLQVWVFNSGNEQHPVGYCGVGSASSSLVADAYGNVSLIISIAQDRLSPEKRLDFYIAANASSSGIELNPETTRQTLEQLTFSSFSPDDYVRTVPSGGLPMSRVVKSVDAGNYLSRESNPASSIEIPLVRSVSKILFILAQPEGLTGATIQQIVLHGNTIAQSPYYFPPAVYYSSPLPEPEGAHIRSADGYHSSEIILYPDDIRLNTLAEPEQYVIGPEENLQDYINRLSSSGMQASGLAYLKESDRSFSGIIYYTTSATGSQLQEAPFRLDAGKFIRNREWIIYAFFSKDRLYVHPTVADWNDAGDFAFDWRYTNLLTNMTGMADTRILESEGEEYIMAAYGKTYAGLPYSPKLQLEASCTGDATAKMILRLDNPDFGLIEDLGGILSPIKDMIEISLSPTPVSVTFYVSPKRLFDLAGSNPENPVAKLRLFLTSGHLASIRLPFNALSLPGDTDYIRYHYVTPDQFQ